MTTVAAGQPSLIHPPSPNVPFCRPSSRRQSISGSGAKGKAGAFPAQALPNKTRTRRPQITMAMTSKFLFASNWW